jgi:hypothetical protein
MGARAPRRSHLHHAAAQQVGGNHLHPAGGVAVKQAGVAVCFKGGGARRAKAGGRGKARLNPTAGVCAAHGGAAAWPGLEAPSPALRHLWPAALRRPPPPPAAHFRDRPALLISTSMPRPGQRLRTMRGSAWGQGWRGEGQRQRGSGGATPVRQTTGLEKTPAAALQPWRPAPVCCPEPAPPHLHLRLLRDVAHHRQKVRRREAHGGAEHVLLQLLQPLPPARNGDDAQACCGGVRAGPAVS